MQRESDRMNTTTKITPSVRQEVLRLLSAVPRGLSSDSWRRLPECTGATLRRRWPSWRLAGITGASQ